MRVYGPYKQKDGRYFVILVYEDGTRKTSAYARYLMEQHLGRSLTDEEEVDHIDNDNTNDNIENLQILTREENMRKEREREERKEKFVS